MQNLNYKNFWWGISLSFVVAIILFCLSCFIGKANFFLLLNNDLGSFGDYFFAVWTNLGDGLMWLAIAAILVFVLRRKDLLPLMIAGFAISTIVTQAFKYLIWPDELRPYKAIADKALIHTVSFVEPFTTSSFPSGHTGTAFCIYLLFCLVIVRNWWVVIGLLFAMLVGYSRVYLAQHFPLDVAGGIIVGIITMLLSVQIQKLWVKKKMNKKNYHDESTVADRYSK